MKKYFATVLLLFVWHNLFAECYTINRATAISVKIIDEILITKKSSEITTLNCVISADVYDKEGKTTVIKKDTPVEVQCVITKPSLWGNAAKIIIQPISTTAINGQVIVFDEEKVVYHGDDDAIFSRRKTLHLPAGTAFRAYTANHTIVRF